MNRKPVAFLLLIGALCGLLFNPLGPLEPADAAVQQLTAHTGLAIRDFRLSPDGQWIVYRLNDYPNGVTSLYSVRVSGGEPIRLAAAVTPNERFSFKPRQEFEISPDSQRVLYFGRPAPTATPTPTPGVRYPGFGLHSVPIDGSAASTTVVDDPHVHRFAFSPDSQSALYTTGTDAEGGLSSDVYRFELYRKPIAGGAAQRLSIDLPAGQSVAYEKWTVLNTGYVVYLAGTLSLFSSSDTSIGSVDIYSVPIGGTSAQSLKLNPCGTVFSAGAYDTTANGQRLTIRGADCDGGGTLRSMAVTGGSSTRLSPVGAAGSPQFHFVTDDDRFVVFQFSESVNQQSRRDLYIAPINGPVSEIHLVQSGDISGINPALAAVAPNGEWLAYLSSTVAGDVDLLLAARTGPTNGPRVVGQLWYDQVINVVFTPDSRYLLYPRSGLMGLDLTTSSGPIGLGSVSPSPYRVVTRGMAERIAFFGGLDRQLYSVPAAGPASGLLRIGHAQGATYTSPVIVADGRKVVYLAEVDNQLYITDIDQPAFVPTATQTLPPNCQVTPGPTFTAGPTRTPFPTQYPIYMPVVKQCYPIP